jgi:hypothetical protein
MIWPLYPCTDTYNPVDRGLAGTHSCSEFKGNEKNLYVYWESVCYWELFALMYSSEELTLYDT